MLNYGRWVNKLNSYAAKSNVVGFGTAEFGRDS